MSGCKTEEERQLDSGYYERYMLLKENLLPESVKKLGENPFLDSYVIEFLNLPNEFHENDLRKALIKNMKDFILELGKDFTFIDEEYKVQVGGDDFRIDLLFYHRGLQCLVAIELKIGKFKPEYISKLDFYLEALDRQVKKENENPSVGLLLCAAKNDEVVEYDKNAKTNYQEAVAAAKKIKTKMKIVPVRTFDDAVRYLEKNKIN